MATFPSDEIWEKFDLSETCGVTSSNDIDFDIDAIMDDTFADLEDFTTDFGINDVTVAVATVVVVAVAVVTVVVAVGPSHQSP